MNKEIIQTYIPEKAHVEWSHNIASFEVPTPDVIAVINSLYYDKKLSLKLITATDERKEYGCFKIWYIFSVPGQAGFIAPFLKLTNTEEFPSVTPTMHIAGGYERRIHTFFGLTPVGHPDLRPIILHENWPADIFPLRKDFDIHTRPEQAHGNYSFQKVDGEGIYEIPVGPIHAGIIEPGHFRFSVAGEEIMLLEARLGFVHKGSEKLFETLGLHDQVRLSERISGDSSFSHSLAFCQAIEQLADIDVPRRARYLRLIFAELERLANHFGDIGAIMIDTGFNFGGSQGSRLREMIMRINERLTGSRFLRGVITAGGVTKDITSDDLFTLSTELTSITKDFSEVIEIAENSVSLFNRLEDTGTLAHASAKDFGTVGVPAKAVGIPLDTRVNAPYAAYNELPLARIEIEHSGDVNARFHVRIKEVYAAFDLIQRAISAMPKGAITADTDTIAFPKNALAMGIVEGWRGEIVYFITTDSEGHISRVVPRDPSFLNWFVVGGTGYGNMVPDFPLINKSFNLSYSGNDL